MTNRVLKNNKCPGCGDTVYSAAYGGGACSTQCADTPTGISIKKIILWLTFSTTVFLLFFDVHFPLIFLLIGLVFNSVLKNPNKRIKSRKTEDYNPANGLPMMGTLDIKGNFYGTNSNQDN